MRLLWAPWSVVVWLLAFALMLLTFLLSAPLLLFLPFERFQPGFPAALMTLVVRLTWSRIERTYHPRYDPKRVSFYMGNHTSLLDPHMILATLPVPFCGIMNAIHTKYPVYGWLMRIASSIPVHPGKEGQSPEVIACVKERVSRGISVVVMPEAHRTLDGKLRAFRRGGFFLARDAGVPVVPLAFRGLYRVLPKGTWIFRPGRVSAWVGPQVETAGLTDDQVTELASRFRDFIAAYVETGVPPADPLLNPGPTAPVEK